MNFKKILMLLLFIIAIIGITSPVEAKLDSNIEIESLKMINDKTKLILDVVSDIGVKNKNPDSANLISKRKAELNKVNKITVTIKGHNTISFKKPNKG
jgi:hypothetical protein